MYQISDRKSISDDLFKYDYLAKLEDFVEVTEWSNGEGWDITFVDHQIYLTEGQLDAINFLTKVLKYQK